jgi:hypothetical protein
MNFSGFSIFLVGAKAPARITSVELIGVLRLRVKPAKRASLSPQGDRARDRGLVFRPSTSAEVGYVLIREEQRLGHFGRSLGCAQVKFFHIFSDPAHA